MSAVDRVGAFSSQVGKTNATRRDWLRSLQPTCPQAEELPAGSRVNPPRPSGPGRTPPPREVAPPHSIPRQENAPDDPGESAPGLTIPFRRMGAVQATADDWEAQQPN